MQESPYASSMNTSLYKFGLSETGSTSYYDYDQAYVVNDHVPGISEYRRTPENSSAITTDQIPTVNTQCEGNTNTTTTHATPVECKFIAGLILIFFFPNKSLNSFLFMGEWFGWNVGICGLKEFDDIVWVLDKKN